MPENCQILSDRMSEKAIDTSRWYVGGYVRIVVQGGDHEENNIHKYIHNLIRKHAKPSSGIIT
jgi:hypothetical protein